MKHKRHRKDAKFNFKHLAAAFAGAAILSAVLPGVAAPTAHASPDPNAGNAPDAEETTKAPDPQDTQKTPDTEKVNQIDKQMQKEQAQDKQDQEDSQGPKTPEHFKKVLNITATAYAPGPHDNDQWGNKTFSGTQIRPGIIAVDPDIIPLGSTVYIQYPDGHGTYAVAEDTGGAIKGHRIDVAKWTVNEAQDFGIQHVKVFVVKTPEKT